MPLSRRQPAGGASVDTDGVSTVSTVLWLGVQGGCGPEGRVGARYDLIGTAGPRWPCPKWQRAKKAGGKKERRNRWVTARVKALEEGQYKLFVKVIPACPIGGKA